MLQSTNPGNNGQLDDVAEPGTDKNDGNNNKNGLEKLRCSGGLDGFCNTRSS